MRKYYQRYPMDVAVVQRIVLRLLDYPQGGAPLPDGGILRPRGLQLLGATPASPASYVRTCEHHLACMLLSVAAGAHLRQCHCETDRIVL